MPKRIAYGQALQTLGAGLMKLYEIKRDEKSDAADRAEREADRAETRDYRKKTLALDRDQFEEATRERNRQYGLDLAKFGESGRQFNEGLGIDKDKLAENTRQFDLSRNDRLKAADREWDNLIRQKYLDSESPLKDMNAYKKLWYENPNDPRITNKMRELFEREHSGALAKASGSGGGKGSRGSKDDEPEISALDGFKVWTKMMPNEKEEYGNSFGRFLREHRDQAQKANEPVPKVPRGGAILMPGQRPGMVGPSPGVQDSVLPEGDYNKAVMQAFNPYNQETWPVQDMPRGPESLADITPPARPTYESLGQLMAEQGFPVSPPVTESKDEISVELDPNGEMDPNLSDEEEQLLALLSKWDNGTATPEEIEILQFYLTPAEE